MLNLYLPQAKPITGHTQLIHLAEINQNIQSKKMTKIKQKNTNARKADIFITILNKFDSRN